MFGVFLCSDSYNWVKFESSFLRNIDKSKTLRSFDVGVIIYMYVEFKQTFKSNSDAK